METKNYLTTQLNYSRTAFSQAYMIYHIATQEVWNSQLQLASYFPTEFEKEGFIHLSTEAQLTGVLQRYYKGREDLLLLTVDETKLTAPLKYEPSTGNELYPHLFGGLDKSAVVKVESIPKVE